MQHESFTVFQVPRSSYEILLLSRLAATELKTQQNPQGKHWRPGPMKTNWNLAVDFRQSWMDKTPVWNHSVQNPEISSLPSQDPYRHCSSRTWILFPVIVIQLCLIIAMRRTGRQSASKFLLCSSVLVFLSYFQFFMLVIILSLFCF